jgi:hypothetical protein
LDAPHRDSSFLALKLGKARHQHLLGDKYFCHSKDREQTRNQRRDLPFNFHGSATASAICPKNLYEPAVRRTILCETSIDGEIIKSFIARPLALWSRIAAAWWQARATRLAGEGRLLALGMNHVLG